MTRLIRHLSVVFIAVALAGGVGCSSKKKADEEGVSTDADMNAMGDSDTGQAMGMETVNFPYDSYVLTDSAKKKLNANGAILKDKSSLKIQVEGHCDERGGIQYNLALGEKRAEAARKYLVDQGVEGDRITTISFGKERPLDKGHSEGAWSKNRRANFVITSR